MKILGIETSCDETAVCLIEAKGDHGSNFAFSVLGQGLISQAAMHAEFGGVFPNLAKREHAKNLVPLLERALREAGLTAQAENPTIYGSKFETLLAREPELLAQITAFLAKYKKPAIDAIAVTHGPGLEPALWVGVNFAKALSLAWDLPIVAVNHMEGHIMMSLMAHSHTPKYEGMFMTPFEFPLLSLLISGGHTELLLSRAWMQYERLGETRDDAAGEAFDKVARLLGLPYPGGPEISKLAAEAREKHLQFGESLTRPMMSGYDFSFSGLKTAVRRIVESRPEMTMDEKVALAREFEDTVTDVLVEKTIRAVEEFGAGTVVVGGGVSANTNIRKVLQERLASIGGVSLLIPPPALATDNALMIALAGYFRALKGEYIEPANLAAAGNLRLGN